MSRTITKAEAAMHLETAPRRFKDRKQATWHDQSSHELLERMLHEAEGLEKRHAVKLAQTLLVHVYSDGIGYEDFESAQATERYIGQAIRALRGLPLGG